MAPTLRSTGQRATNVASTPGPPTSTGKVSLKKPKNRRHTAVPAGPLPCPLLEMPAEIRNRIYGFCKERSFDASRDEPCTLRKSNRTGRSHQRATARSFFSLTQTCQQIRSEYRSLWLRGSSVSLKFGDLSDFLATYYDSRFSQSVPASHAPQLMVILWDHEKSDYKTGDLLLDLKPLLQFRAFCTWFTAVFRCRRLVERDLPLDEYEGCGQCINCNRQCDPGTLDNMGFEEEGDYYDMLPICEAMYRHDFLNEMEGRLRREYQYLESLNGFLENSNESWLKAIRDDQTLQQMKVECTMGYGCKVPTIYIRFGKGYAPPVFSKFAFRSAACQYLTDAGIIDLECRAGLDFIVGVATGKATRHSADCKVVVPTYAQVHICGRSYKAPAVVARPVATGPSK